MYHTDNKNSNFYPRPPRGGRRTACSPRFANTGFLSTPSARRATCDGAHRKPLRLNFYPRPPRGGRPLKIICAISIVRFLSTPSARRATSDTAAAAAQVLFLSTPSARRATFTFRLTPDAFRISIHALREEGDTPWNRHSRYCQDFYPRPPRGGRPRSGRMPPLRCNFYPRPPRGGRLLPASIALQLSYFYPRPPRGGRPALPPARQFRRYFYPRPPRGGRREMLDTMTSMVKFLSTPSARRATACWWMHRRTHCDFYPRPPRGGRLKMRGHSVWRGDISIHALREEGDEQRRTGRPYGRCISIHALREEGDVPSMTVRQ